MANVHVPLVQAKNLFYYLNHVLPNSLHIQIPKTNKYDVIAYYYIIFKKLTIYIQMISAVEIVSAKVSSHIFVIQLIKDYIKFKNSSFMVNRNSQRF